MFKTAYNANGLLSAPLANDSNTMLVPPAVSTYLANLLDFNVEGDFTYLKIGSDSVGYEVVMVINAAVGTLEIVRAQDGTLAQAFAVNTPFRYELTAAAIADIVNDASSFPADLIGDYPINVEQQDGGVWVISIAPLNLTSTNETVDVTGNYPDIDLAVSPNANGCC